SPDVGLPHVPASAGRAVVNNNVKDLRFSAVDANSDGRISLPEFVTFMDAGNVSRNAGDNRGGVNPMEELLRQIERNHANALSVDVEVGMGFHAVILSAARSSGIGKSSIGGQGQLPRRGIEVKRDPWTRCYRGQNAPPFKLTAVSSTNPPPAQILDQAGELL